MRIPRRGGILNAPIRTFPLNEGSEAQKEVPSLFSEISNIPPPFPGLSPSYTTSPSTLFFLSHRTVYYIWVWSERTTTASSDWVSVVWDERRRTEGGKEEIPARKARRRFTPYSRLQETSQLRIQLSSLRRWETTQLGSISIRYLALD